MADKTATEMWTICLKMQTHAQRRKTLHLTGFQFCIEG